jgi:hypothetical protein
MKSDILDFVIPKEILEKDIAVKSKEKVNKVNKERVETVESFVNKNYKQSKAKYIKEVEANYPDKKEELLQMRAEKLEKVNQRVKASANKKKEGKEVLYNKIKDSISKAEIYNLFLNYPGRHVIIIKSPVNNKSYRYTFELTPYKRY